MAITFDAVEFKIKFPEFVSKENSDLQLSFDVAILYISNEDYGRLRGEARKQALYLMTAHITSYNDQVAAGDTPGSVTSATIGTVSVTVKPSPDGPQWQWWLNQTPYGVQLLAMLSMLSFNFYVGGRNERGSFRKSWGGF